MVKLLDVVFDHPDELAGAVALANVVSLHVVVVSILDTGLP